MSWIEITLYAGALIGFISMGALVARSPSFWVGLIIAGIKAALPYLFKIFGPRDLTQHQKDKIARGEEPNLKGQSARPFDRGKE